MKKITLFLLFWQHLLSIGAEDFRINPNLIQYELDNGMQIVLSPRTQGDLVAVQLFVHAGSMMEESHLGSGVSHLLEHLCFKGTEGKAPTQLARDVQKKGGIINAHTSYTSTVYEVTFPKKSLKDALKIVSELVLQAKFDLSEFEKEKTVIEREMDLNEDNHNRFLSQLFWKTAYRVSPVKHPVIGYRSLLRTLNIKDVQTYYKKQYTPRNMILVVTGAFDVPITKMQIEKYYNIASTSFLPLQKTWIEPEPMGEKRIEKERPHLSQCQAIVGWRTTPIDHPDVPVLDVLAMILGGMNTALLQEQLVSSGKILSGSAWSFTPEFQGVLGAHLIWQDAQETENVLQALDAIIKRVQNGDFSEELLKISIQQIALALFSKIESVEGEADMLGIDLQSTGHVRFTEHWLRALSQVSKPQIIAAAQKYLTPNRKTTVLICPPSTSTPKNDSSLRYEKKPTLHTLSSGLRVVVLEDPSLPLIDFQWVGLGGTLSETPGQMGLGALLGNVLGNATAKNSEKKLHKRFETLGAHVQGFSGRNSFGLKCRTLSENWEKTLSLFFETLTIPEFPEHSVAREKKKLVAEMKFLQEDPFERASAEMRQSMYGNHAYGRLLGSSVEDMDRYTTEDLKNYFQPLFALQNGVFCVIGQIKTEHLLPWLEKNVKIPKRSSFPSVSISAPPTLFPPVFKKSEKQILLDSEQTVLILGFKTVPLGHEDEIPLQFLSHYFSGQASPLFTKIREERALAYLTGSAHQSHVTAGHFLLYAAYKEPVTEEIEKIMRKVLEDACEKMTPELFEEVRTSFLGQDIRTRANASDLVTTMALMELYGLHYDRYLKFVDLITQLTPEHVQEVAKRYFEKTPYAKVIVGKQANAK
jgi:zinc protease